MLKVSIKTFVSISLFFAPFILNAQIIITEVMYNPDGTDSGREWVEIYNSGSESLDISDYKLLENNVNHKLSAHDPSDAGNLLIGAGEYAIIADNSTKFLADYTEKGLLIDSAFSLKNTGEEVSIVNPTEEIIDSFSYLPELGADGTGNSLQLINLSGNSTQNDWIPAEPTPFVSNKTEAVDETVDSGESTGSGSNSSSNSSSGSSTRSSSQSTHSSISDVFNYKPKIDLKISSGRERYVTINTEIEFELIHNQESSKGISTVWSMGDGTQVRGKKINHIYTSAGDYNVILNAKNKTEKTTSRTKVYVSEPLIELNYSIWGKTVDVLLKNTSKKELNIGDFYVVLSSSNRKKTFKIAPDTIIDPNQVLNLNSKITNFELIEFSNKISLYYPNNEKLKDIEIRENNHIYEILSPYLGGEKIKKLETLLNN